VLPMEQNAYLLALLPMEQIAYRLCNLHRGQRRLLLVLPMEQNAYLLALLRISPLLQLPHSLIPLQHELLLIELLLIVLLLKLLLLEHVCRILPVLCGEHITLQARHQRASRENDTTDIPTGVRHSPLQPFVIGESSAYRSFR
jgi:hypothetical protein